MDNSNRRLTHQKKSGAGNDEIFQSQWSFYGYMDSFLKDFVSTRSTESNLEKLSRTDTYHLKNQKVCTKKQHNHRRR